jgi:hypothetical protein
MDRQMTITEDNYKALRKRYEKALDNGEEVFQVPEEVSKELAGQDMLVDYCKYVLEYIENKHPEWKSN